MIETITAFFAVGAVGFFLYLLILTIAFVVASECDHHVFAIIAALVGALLYKAHILALILNWKLFLVCFLVYGLVGGIWSIFRWFKYCKKTIAEHPYDKRSSWEDKKSREEYYTEMLTPANHKSRITSWIIYWPFSFVWNALGDFFTGIYESLSKAYHNIAASIVKKAIRSSTDRK